MKPVHFSILCLFLAFMLLSGCKNSTEPEAPSKTSLLTGRSWVLTDIDPISASNTGRIGTVFHFKADNSFSAIYEDSTEKVEAKGSWYFSDNETRLRMGVIGNAEILDLSTERMQLRVLDQPKVFVETYKPL